MNIVRNIITILLVLFSIHASAQQDRREKINAYKTAYITGQLSLTKTEAEKFWPIYNAYEDAQFKVRNGELRNIRRQIDSDINGMTDKEALVLLQKLERAEETLHKQRRQLTTDLGRIISPLKILKLKRAEEEFNRRLLKQYRGKGPQRK